MLNIDNGGLLGEKHMKPGIVTVHLSTWILRVVSGPWSFILMIVVGPALENWWWLGTINDVTVNSRYLLVFLACSWISEVFFMRCPCATQYCGAQEICLVLGFIVVLCQCLCRIVANAP